MSQYKGKVTSPNTAAAFVEVWQTSSNLVLVMFETATGDTADVRVITRHQVKGSPPCIYGTNTWFTTLTDETAVHMIDNYKPIP